MEGTMKDLVSLLDESTDRSHEARAHEDYAQARAAHNDLLTDEEFRAHLGRLVAVLNVMGEIDEEDAAELYQDLSRHALRDPIDFLMDENEDEDEDEDEMSEEEIARAVRLMNARDLYHDLIKS
jgi:hypothetical protein